MYAVIRKHGKQKNRQKHINGLKVRQTQKKKYCALTIILYKETIFK